MTSGTEIPGEVPVPTPAAGSAPPGVGRGAKRREPPAPWRIRVAWAVALIADALQLAVFPMMLWGAVSPLDDIIDGVVALVLMALLGWHLAFLPSFLIKLLPVLDLAPMWTLAVAFVTRRTAPERR
jgi:hypothetical protein